MGAEKMCPLLKKSLQLVLAEIPRGKSTDCLEVRKILMSGGLCCFLIGGKKLDMYVDFITMFK